MLFSKQDTNKEKKVDVCPYCHGKDFIRSGQRQKKMETVQVYYCKKCRKKFTPAITKNRTFPLRIILDAITAYNRFNTLEESSALVGKKYGIEVSGQNISNWLKDFKDYLPFLKMREFVEKKYDKRDIFSESRMFHGQIYDFKYHRAKTDLLLEEHYKHYKFRPLQEFLELVTVECPHQIFKDSGKRASDFKDVFNLDQVRITRKENTAVKNARFILQAITNNKLRHEILQEFMLVNDSVTVACELPVLLAQEDIIHYQSRLNFDVPISLEDDEAVTGHIDIIQIRNGMVHILDYKPSARKEKPIAQLTLYALALSRLTSLRLFHFKCAWFDKDDYFEFYPLHVVYKKKSRKKSKTDKAVNGQAEVKEIAAVASAPPKDRLRHCEEAVGEEG
ncbi:MAG: PD-(D/E)XK nuclease family protein [Candidatus Omnitrophota bacterium]